jgi:hypothetical protein
MPPGPHFPNPSPCTCCCLNQYPRDKRTCTKGTRGGDMQTRDDINGESPRYDLRAHTSQQSNKQCANQRANHHPPSYTTCDRTSFAPFDSTSGHALGGEWRQQLNGAALQQKCLMHRAGQPVTDRKKKPCSLIHDKDKGNKLKLVDCAV